MMVDLAYGLNYSYPLLKKPSGRIDISSQIKKLALRILPKRQRPEVNVPLSQLLKEGDN